MTNDNTLEPNKLILLQEQLLYANQTAIELAGFLIWRIDLEIDPEIKYVFVNNKYIETLGLTPVAPNKILYSDFHRTIYPDEEGKKTQNILSSEFLLIKDNLKDSFVKVVGKHRNLINGDAIYLEHNTKVVDRFDDGSLKVIGGFILDVTNEFLHKKELERILLHDNLTGLENRVSLDKFLTSYNNASQYSIVFFDIDNLKAINQTKGFEFGNQLILHITNLIVEQFSSDSTIYRIGGDEILVYSKNIIDQEIFSRIINIENNLKKYSEKQNMISEITYGYEINKDTSVTIIETLNTAESILYRRKIRNQYSRKSQALNTILNMLNTKTEETTQHCNRLRDNAVKILNNLGHTQKFDIEEMELLCQLHDIGKIAIPEEILLKESSLTDAEYNRVKEHSKLGYEIVDGIVDSKKISMGVLHHHERWDGTGYPLGLSGDNIPLFARIIGIVDAYDVMLLGRKYVKRKTKEMIINEYTKNLGKQFDPTIGSLFIEMIKSGTV